MRPLPVVVCLCLCLGRPCSATVGAWVNSGQSLRPWPAFVVVFGLGAMVQLQRDFVGCVGKFRTIVAAVAGFCLCCCVWFVWGDGAACSATCGCVGKFRTIVAAVASFCLCCVCVWGEVVQHDFVGVWV